MTKHPTRSLLTIVVLLLIVLSISCGIIPGLSPTNTSPETSAAPPNAATSPPAASAPGSPSPTSSSTPAVSPTPGPPADASPGASPFAAPSPAAPATSGILSDWSAPSLSEAPPSPDLSDLVDQVIPWIVSINVEITSTDFFGQPATRQGAGSGWIIDSNGIIITNSHVVESADVVTVSLADGRTFPVLDIAADPPSDLAVLKIDASGLPVAVVGDSGKMRKGMMVMAIGNALGEGISMTAGWVSQLEASITVPVSGTETSETMYDLIRTSAPINPGNSGGPLVNMLGEVVGITSVKLVSQGVENIGYAISTRSAMPLIEQLVRTGQITRPYIGVSLRTVTPDIASMFGLAVNEGAIIAEIAPGGPAAGAGLQAGDVITEINGQKVVNASDAARIIRSNQIGQSVTVAYYRGDNQATAQVTLAPRPSS
ncbi:MAG: trypsin-like peptidase domain-containing protein [Dehalococcoidales bacterium]|nr:trypsin-like peptidase domain-containing protein [Dehalococcoidales bacterium]